MTLTPSTSARTAAFAPAEPLDSLVRRLQDGDKLGAEDVLALRRCVYADDAVLREEVALLLDLDDALGPMAAAEWGQFLSEALTAHFVHQARPAGYIASDDAAWLIERLGGDAPSLGASVFTMLLTVMERARSVPDPLAAFGLRVVEAIVLTGQGGNVTGECHAPGRVTRADVEALRRVLHVASSEGFGQVTRAEAEVLFSIAEATIDAANDPSFADLFARAVANHILSPGGRLAPSAAQALRREIWLDESRPLRVGIGSFFRSALGSLVGGEAATEPPARELLNCALAPEQIDADEARWLAERIGRIGRLSEAEHRLLAFLEEETGALPKSLAALVSKGRPAAPRTAADTCQDGAAPASNG